MKINPIYKGGLLLILMGLVTKITALLIFGFPTSNYFFAGMGFTAIGIGMIGYVIYKNKSINI